MVNPRQPCWSPSGQSYSPLSRHQVTQHPEPIERAGWRPHQPARRSIAQVDTAVRDIQIVLESGLVPSPTEVSGQGKHLRGGQDVLLNNEMSGGVAMALNPPAMVPDDVDDSVTPLMGDVGSVLPNVLSPMVAERAPLADRVDKVLIDSVGVSPLAAAGGGGALVCCGCRCGCRCTTGGGS